MASRLLKISGSLRTVPQRFKSSFKSEFRAALEATPRAEITQVDNGLRVASINNGAETATVGLWIDAGSRYEDAKSRGVGNFLNRLIFKGTGKRPSLETDVANLGATLGSYAGREQTAVFAQCLAEDVPKLVEILADAIQDPKLDDAEIERVRKVLLQENEASDDNVEEVIFNNLHACAYAGTPLGPAVIGNTKALQSISRADLKNYIDTHFKSSRIVLAAAGGVDHRALVSAAEKSLGSLDNTFDGVVPVLTPCRYTGSEIRWRYDDIPSAHCAFAMQTGGWNSPDALPLQIANAVLGSWDNSKVGGIHNSSLLAKIAAQPKEFGEEGGALCESFRPFIFDYQDTGLFGLYFVSGVVECKDMAVEAQSEVRKLSTTVPEGDIQRGRNIVKMNALRKLNGTQTICDDLGRQVLRNGVHKSVADLVPEIESISAERVREACYNNIYETCPVISSYGSIEALPEYIHFRNRTYSVIW